MVKTLMPYKKTYRKRKYSRSRFSNIYPSPAKSQVIYMTTEESLITVIGSAFIVKDLWADEICLHPNFYNSTRQMWQKYRVERVVASLTMPANSTSIPVVDSIFMASDHSDFFQATPITKDALMTNPNCRILSTDLNFKTFLNTLSQTCTFDAVLCLYNK